MPMPKSTKPWRQRKIRVSHLEDTLIRLVDSIEDTKSRLVVQEELASLRAREKVMHEEKCVVASKKGRLSGAKISY